MSTNCKYFVIIIRLFIITFNWQLKYRSMCLPFVLVVEAILLFYGFITTYVLYYVYICTMEKNLVYRTRFSATFTRADKSYLTYPDPTCEIDTKRITTRVVNTLVV